jgi:DNA invertase Pin-like site-specific DNA recombinase
MAAYVATYCVTRASTTDQKTSDGNQEDEARQYCQSKGIDDLQVLNEPTGTSGCVPFRKRPMGKWLLAHANKGDTVIFASVDRIARKMADVLTTVDRLKAKGVSVVILQFNGLQLDLSSDIGQLILGMTAFGAQLEHSRIRERTAQAREKKMREGTWCTRAGCGRIKVRDDAGAHWSWDFDQLKLITEIAFRLGRGEQSKTVAEDFWRRQLKDHRGLPWGEIQNTRGRTLNPYARFNEAVRWFHRMKHAGKLPPPYCDLAALAKEGKRFSVKPRRIIRKHVKPPAEEVDHSNWTAEEWSEWAEENELT